MRPRVVGRDRDEGQAEDAADAAVGVVGLVGGGDGLGRGASWPATQRASRLAKVPPLERWPRCWGQLEHLCERGDGFDLHGGAGAAAVERVVVGVDRHGQRVGGAGDGVRRLQHLAGVERMGVGIVVVEALCYLLEDCGGCFAEGRRGVGRQVGEALVQSALRFGEELEEFVWHRFL